MNFFYLTVILPHYNHSDTEKNHVQIVQLPVIWAKCCAIANKQLTAVAFQVAKISYSLSCECVIYEAVNTFTLNFS
jgi:hypothetical protein